MHDKVDVYDVARYILNKMGRMSCMKLQKLVYYCQAWSLVWDDKPLFPERIEAWVNGPVVRELFDIHRGRFDVSSRSIPGNTKKLDAEQKETIDAVLDFYGGKSSQWLSDLSHNEHPWKKARQGLGPRERGHNPISLASMANYYGSLVRDVEEESTEE